MVPGELMVLTSSLALLFLVEFLLGVGKRLHKWDKITLPKSKAVCCCAFDDCYHHKFTDNFQFLTPGKLRKKSYQMCYYLMIFFCQLLHSAHLSVCWWIKIFLAFKKIVAKSSLNVNFTETCIFKSQASKNTHRFLGTVAVKQSNVNAGYLKIRKTVFPRWTC